MLTLVVTLIAVGGLAGLLCRGPNGMFSILGRKTSAARLQREITELQDTEALIRSDIKSYQDTARVKRIAQEKYGMSPKQPKPGTGESLAGQPGPAQADSGRR